MDRRPRARATTASSGACWSVWAGPLDRWDRGAGPRERSVGGRDLQRSGDDRARLPGLARRRSPRPGPPGGRLGADPARDPSGDDRYSIGGALATVLGPRDDAWLDAAVADSALRDDIAPWWADATDGRSLLNQALVLMWLEIRWRRPALEERAGALRRGPSPPVPRVPDRPGPRVPVDRVGRAGRASRHRRPDGPPGDRRAERDERHGAPIGYRRAPVRISHEGWVLEGPRLVRRAPDRRGVVGRRGRPGHHARRGR